MLKWIITIFLAVIIAIISRASLRKPRSHGFWRFFAWELILVLIAINLDFWFINPFSWNQIIAWVLLFTSLIPLLLGVRSLKSSGNPAKNRDGEPQLMTFEKTTTLVSSGIYRYIRHPLYSSLLLLACGVFFKYPTCLAGGLTLAASFFLFLTARADEKECLLYFGESYQNYMNQTKRFLPFIF